MSWTPRLPADTQPLYVAIADAIADDAESGRLAPGTRLPTHRALARSLGVDVTTVSRAYAEAHRRGLVVGHVGRGTYVRGGGRVQAPPRATAAPLVDLTVNLPPEPSEACDDAMRRSLAELARTPEIASLLAYAPAGGSTAHREAAAAWCTTRGVSTSPDRVLVCGGAQQALTSILSAHCEPGDVVLTESLTYPGFIAAAALLRLRVVGVELDRDGLVPEALVQACRAHRPKVLLATPTLQNPTATVMPVARRRRIASALRDREVVILEDDTYAPLVPDAPRPIASLVPELAYFVCSLSKAVTPALRTAFVVTPNAAAAVRMSPHVQATGWLSPPLMSEIASRWVTSGVAAKIVAERRAEAAARQAIVRERLGLPKNAGSPHALHHWLELPRQWERASDFVEALRRRGVLVTSGDAFAVDPSKPTRAVRVSLGAAPSHTALAHALETIAGLLRESPEFARPAR
ncbi:MAG TPA: PLP-dependent aminotransferase family protein [Gemmatimonadaceae bacterium]|nr:PLP-dependent aminotransferase family protein [Gemmatimonadaceae bacterium]